MKRPIFALWFEAALALAVIASVAATVQFFRANGYLPQPFVFDTNDTFMDWFNTAYWANNPGAFDVWRSIYPPLSFAFLDLTSLHECYLIDPFHARDCDWLARGTIAGLYILDVVLAWMSFRKADPRTAPMRTVAIGLGLPLLFTLERGNLILAAFACFMLAHGSLLKSARWRALAGAATINFKPYLLLPVLQLALRRRWRALELAGVATIAIYLATLAWVGGGTPGELASNTANWVIYQGGQVWNEVNYSTSYAPLLTIRTAPIPLLSFVPSRTVEAIEFAVPLAIAATQMLAFAALIAIWLQPQSASPGRAGAVILGAYLVTQSPGGYTQLFLLFLVLLEPLRRPGPAIAVTCTYLLSLMGDVQLAAVLDITSTSWLGGRTVNPQFGLTLGQLVRPGLVIVIVWALSLDSIWLSAKAHVSWRPRLGLARACRPGVAHTCQPGVGRT